MAHSRLSSRLVHERQAAAGDVTTEAIEDYAKAIYALEARGDGPVGTSALAERLEVAPSTVTAMAKRLDELGLVTYTPYRGVVLTEAGRRVALEVVRHHRLLEAFLAQSLGMPWDRVHDEAEVLEHHISEELERRIAAQLGEPSIDPHGDPIPSAELKLAADRTLPLLELEAGDEALFARVSDSDSEMLRFLDQRGIRPGMQLKLVDRQPFDGPLFVEVGGREHVLGRGLAAAMRVVVTAGGR